MGKLVELANVSDGRLRATTATATSMFNMHLPESVRKLFRIRAKIQCSQNLFFRCFDLCCLQRLESYRQIYPKNTSDTLVNFEASCDRLMSCGPVYIGYQSHLCHGQYDYVESSERHNLVKVDGYRSQVWSNLATTAAPARACGHKR